MPDPLTTRTLTQIAADIGGLVKDMQGAGHMLLSSRLCMGQLLAEAKKLFANKSEFRTWCEKNVIRSNGKAYSPVTIDNYIMFATVPGRYQRERNYHADYQAKERATVQEHRYDSQGETATRYQALLSLWRASSEDDRQRFVSYLKGAHFEYFKAGA